MPTDNRVEPEGKPTKPEVASPTERELLKSLIIQVGGLQTTFNERVDLLEAKFETRIGSLEASRVDTNARLNTSSLRVKTTSDNDLRQDSAIAKIVTDVAAIKVGQAAGNEMLGEVKTALKSYFRTNPAAAMTLIGALIGLLMAATSAATIYFQNYGKH